ncbi:MAG: MFS transporter [Actinomycetales bacterium]
MCTSHRAGLFVIVFVVFVMSLDVTMLNVVLTDIGLDIGADQTQLAWIADCYNISLAGLILLGAGLGGRLGQRAVYLAGLLIFAAGSVWASFVTEPTSLIAARTVMGIGAAGLAAPSVALVGEMFPDAERTKALATWAAASGLGLALGPILGGLIMDLSDWRWTFLAMVPMILAAYVLGRSFLPAGTSGVSPRLDINGAALSALALIPLVTALLQAPDFGWANPVILVGLGSGMAGVLAFCLHELRARAPMIDLRVLRIPMVSAAALALAGAFIGFLGLQFLASLQLRAQFGLGPVQAGLALAPWAILYWIGARTAATLVPRFGAPAIIAFGLVLVGLAFVFLATFSGLGPAIVSTGMSIAGLGGGLIIPVSVNVMMSSTPEALLPTTSGLSMIARFGGGAVGLAVLASAAAAAGSTEPGYLVGIMILLALGVGTGWFLGRARRTNPI